MKTLKLLFVALMLIGISGNLQSQITTGHYGPGLFGMRSSHGFPLGFSYANVTQIYSASEMKDNFGKVSTLAKPINVMANASALIWGARLEKLNANYNAALVVPITNLAPNPETLELDPSKIGVGDAMIIPIMLSWNLNRVAINTRYGLWMPTGSYKNGATNNKGKGFWSHNLGLGVTAYVDQNKTWSISSMNTLEVNSRQKYTNIKPGSNWVMEWSVGKTFDQAFNLGIVGYTNQQITAQKGGELPEGTNHYKVNGIGMELGYKTKDNWAFLTRWYTEYMAINRPEGTAIRFMVLKKF